MSTKKRILLIDDDDALREVLREQFELHEDFETEAVATGQDGLEASKSGEHDLVLLDVGLPDFDGREVCKMMRKSNI
ncbi:MAG: response regulator, partial [Pseudomonadota bacterium]